MSRLVVRLIALVAGGLLLGPLVHAQSPDFLFEPGGSRSVTVDLAGAPDGTLSFSWPDDVAAWDTALLHVAVAADEPDPYVEIAAGAGGDRQYFKTDESGTRWINLSGLAPGLRPGTTVTVRPHGLRIGAGRTGLRLFDGRPDLSGRMLVLAPHPDDAEIAAFGLYANRDAAVVTVTAGNAGSPTYEAVFGDDEAAAIYTFKGRIRVIDSITVPWQGAVPPARTFNLGYFDARLFEMYRRPDDVIPEMYGPNTGTSVYRQYNIGTLLPHEGPSSTWGHLVDDLVALLDEVDPAVIAAPHPQLDTHRDHQFTTVALAQALARTGRKVTLLLYTNHADGNAYPYGPAGTVVSLPTPPVSAGVVLDRVYSHPVTPDLQREKLFALESMHDLRYTPTRQYQLAIGDGRALEPEKPGPGPDITYLRRGPRSNELYFVYDETTLQPMIQRFVDALPR